MRKFEIECEAESLRALRRVMSSLPSLTQPPPPIKTSATGPGPPLLGARLPPVKHTRSLADPALRATAHTRTASH